MSDIQREKFERIIDALGTPYYRDGSTALYHEDAMQTIAAFPQSSIDLTVTSPPYNIGKEYEKKLSVEEYIDWCSSWMSLLFKATDDKGNFCLNVGYLEVPEKGLAVPIPYLLWDKSPFYMLQEIVWNYGAGVACRKRLSPRNEKIIWYVKDTNTYTFNLDPIRDPDVKYPNQKKNGKLKCNPLGKNPSDVWQIAKVTSGKNRASKERAPHPAQFPMELVDRMIKAFSNEEGIVLDPFIGSGSVAESGLKNKRFVIGIEKEEKYLSYAKERIRNRTEDIFASPVPDDSSIPV